MTMHDGSLCIKTTEFFLHHWIKWINERRSDHCLDQGDMVQPVQMMKQDEILV